MSDLEHWIEGGATEGEKKLLDAARGGGPSAEARARMAGALGIGLAVGSVAPAAVKAPLTLAKWLAGKWVILGTLGTVAVAGGAGLQYLRPSSNVAPTVQVATFPTPPGPTVAAAAVVTPPIDAAVDAPIATPASAAPRVVEATANGALAASSRTGRTGGATSTAPALTEAIVAPAATVEPTPSSLAAETGTKAATSSVEAELALLEQAKESLDHHRTADALNAAADYERRYPRGLFVVEAQVIRIEALAHAQRRAEAKSAGDAFLLAHPGAAQAARVRSVLREINAAP